MTPPPERDIDPLTGAELELSGTKKRSSEDATEYPRRRATIAVGLINSLDAEIDKLRLLTVPDMPVTQDTMQWSPSEMPALLRSRRRVCVPRARNQARCWRQADSRTPDPDRRATSFQLGRTGSSSIGLVLDIPGDEQ